MATQKEFFFVPGGKLGEQIYNLNKLARVVRVHPVQVHTEEEEEEGSVRGTVKCRLQRFLKVKKRIRNYCFVLWFLPVLHDMYVA